MGYKLNTVLKKNKKNLIVALVLWVFMSVILVLPFSYSIGQATAEGKFDLGVFFNQIGTNITDFSSYLKVFTEGYSKIFLNVWKIFTLIYAVLIAIGIIKSKPKHEYTDIEHGSSDWSEGGEQYSILSKNKGIILAKNNYLPVDKRGNVNVLVVGRFWLW